MSQGPTASGPVPSILQRVQAVLNRIRPAIQSDGGDVELVEVTPDGMVRIRLHGNCVGCPSSEGTLRSTLEQNIRDTVPEVLGVQQVF